MFMNNGQRLNQFIWAACMQISIKTILDNVGQRSGFSHQHTILIYTSHIKIKMCLSLCRDRHGVFEDLILLRYV